MRRLAFTRMRRDWTAIGASLAFVAVAAMLVLLTFPDSLPSCRSVTGNIDGTDGTPCGSGLDWDGQSVTGMVLALVFSLLALMTLARGMRRRRS